MSRRVAWLCGGVAGLIIGAVLIVGGVATGTVPVDLGVGRRNRTLGPLRMHIAAPPEVVFDVIASPYLHRVPRAMDKKLRVLDRGDDFALAAHYTRANRALTVKTLELLRFSRPHQITFRLLRGPVADGFETFSLDPIEDQTDFEYSGHLSADLWGLGTWWLGVVAPRWERSVVETLASVRSEAERRVAVRRKTSVTR
jgi:hypothetical protein